MTGKTQPSIYHTCKNSKPNTEHPIYNISKSISKFYSKKSKCLSQLLYLQD